MGIIYTFHEETPEGVEYYLQNHKWPSRANLRLRYYDMGKAWELWHSLFCPPNKRHSFPENFIMNETPLPNYGSEYEEGEYAYELTSPFLYSVEKTMMISKFLDSLDKATLRKRCTHQFWIDNGYSAEYTSEEEEDGFHGLYYEFERLQRFFHRISFDNHCVIGRKS